MNYVPIKAVLNYLSRAIQEEEQSELQITSWALQALRMVDFPQKYERKMCILKVEDSKANLPTGWRELNYISYMFKEPEQKEVDELAYCYQKKFAEECGDTTTGDLCKIPLSFGLFVYSDYYNNNFYPMTNRQNQLKNKGIGTNCCNIENCRNSFSIKGDCIYTDLKEGYICVDYDVEYQDDEGNYLVPDDADLMRGIAEYIKYQHWEGRADRHEQNAFSRSQTHLRQAEILLRNARGKQYLRSVDEDRLKDIQYGKMKIVYVPAAYNYRNIGH